jgi:hypothetical protein
VDGILQVQGLCSDFPHIKMTTLVWNSTKLIFYLLKQKTGAENVAILLVASKQETQKKFG